MGTVETSLNCRDSKKQEFLSDALETHVLQLLEPVKRKQYKREEFAVCHHRSCHSDANHVLLLFFLVYIVPVTVGILIRLCSGQVTESGGTVRSNIQGGSWGLG